MQVPDQDPNQQFSYTSCFKVICLGIVVLCSCCIVCSV